MQRSHNIYHSIIPESDISGFYGQQLLEFIKKTQVSNHSALILETRSKHSDMTCDSDFLQACNHFDDIAYVVKEETATYNPWKHAMLVRNSNKNTHYFDSYKDAYKWLTVHHKKTEKKLPLETLHHKNTDKKLPLDFTGKIYKINY